MCTVFFLHLHHFKIRSLCNSLLCHDSLFIQKLNYDVLKTLIGCSQPSHHTHTYLSCEQVVKLNFNQYFKGNNQSE